MEEREIMKRKIISVLLTACLSISLLAGCGGNASKTDDSQVEGGKLRYCDANN